MASSFRVSLFLGLVATMFLLNGCEGPKPAATAPAKPAATPAARARYECPMGCAGSQSSQPGKCPTCEMELVKKS